MIIFFGFQFILYFLIFRNCTANSHETINLLRCKTENDQSMQKETANYLISLTKQELDKLYLFCKKFDEELSFFIQAMDRNEFFSNCSCCHEMKLNKMKKKLTKIQKIRNEVQTQTTLARDESFKSLEYFYQVFLCILSQIEMCNYFEMKKFLKLTFLPILRDALILKKEFYSPMQKTLQQMKSIFQMIRMNENERKKSLSRFCFDMQSNEKEDNLFSINGDENTEKLFYICSQIASRKYSYCGLSVRNDSEEMINNCNFMNSYLKKMFIFESRVVFLVLLARKHLDEFLLQNYSLIFSDLLTKKDLHKEKAIKIIQTN